MVWVWQLDPGCIFSKKLFRDRGRQRGTEGDGEGTGGTGGQRGGQTDGAQVERGEGRQKNREEEVHNIIPSQKSTVQNSLGTVAGKDIKIQNYVAFWPQFH